MTCASICFKRVCKSCAQSQAALVKQSLAPSSRLHPSQPGVNQMVFSAVGYQQSRIAFPKASVQNARCRWWTWTGENGDACGKYYQRYSTYNLGTDWAVKSATMRAIHRQQVYSRSTVHLFAMLTVFVLRSFS